MADITAESNADRAFYKKGGLPLRPAVVSVKKDEKAGKITLSAEEYVHAVELEGGIFEDSCFSLLPGETKVVSYRQADGFETEKITFIAYTVA